MQTKSCPGYSNNTASSPSRTNRRQHSSLCAGLSQQRERVWLRTPSRTGSQRFLVTNVLSSSKPGVDPRLRPLDPGQDQFCHGIAVALDHHHVAVAAHTAISQEPEIGLGIPGYAPWTQDRTSFATASLLLSIIIMWPLPLTPRSPKNQKSALAPFSFSQSAMRTSSSRG